MQALTASLQLPVTREIAFRVVSDLSKLLRLSPFFTLKQFATTDTGLLHRGTSFTITLDHYATRCIETYQYSVAALEPNTAVSFAIETGPVKEIRFDIEPSESGVRLTQTLTLDAADDAVIAGTQNELELWMRSIGEYLKLAERGTLRKKIMLGFMDRVWLKLTLSERNIAIIMTKISALEIALLLVLVLAWRMFAQ